jgi:hypothetical protein
LPGVVVVGEEVFDRVGGVRGEVELVKVQGDHGGLGVDGVKVDGYEDGVGGVAGLSTAPSVRFALSGFGRDDRTWE